MAVAPKYPSEVREAVYALLGKRSCAEIRRLIAADKVGLGYRLDIPKASIYHLKDSLVAERGWPQHTINPGQETEAIDDISRSLLEAGRSRASRILTKERRGQEWSTADNATYRTLCSALPSLTRRYQPRPDTPQRNGGEGKGARSLPLLAQLQKDEGSGNGDEAKATNGSTSYAQEHAEQSTSSGVSSPS